LRYTPQITDHGDEDDEEHETASHVYAIAGLRFSRQGRYKSVTVFSFSVMDFWFRTEDVFEGAARVLVPRLDRAEGEPLDHARSRAAVFYNPAMRLNRDTAVLVLAVQGEALGRTVEACEPM
jgi:hypothetical protein